jgi:hypothetical protein
LIYLADQTTSAYSAFTLSIFVTANGSSSAIRVDAEARPTLVRPKAEHIPTPIKSVDITSFPQGMPGHRVQPSGERTITGTDARGLADLVNNLPAAQGGLSTGVSHSSGWSRLIFYSNSAPITVTINGNGNTVTFKAGSAIWPGLASSNELAAMVARLLSGHR